MNSTLPPESGAEQPPPPHGWYPDPVARERLRLWDGRAWTDQVRAAGAPGVDDGPISFVRPGSPAALPQHHAPANPVTPAYGTPVDFRGISVPRHATEPVGPVATNPRGVRGGLTADGVPLASWWERAGATVLDWLVNIAMVAVVLTVGVTDFWGRYVRESEAWADLVLAGRVQVLDLPPELVHLGSVMSLVAAAVSIVYGIAFLGTSSATLGQRVLRLRVVPFGRGRTKLGWLQAIMRTFVWTLFAQGGSFLVLIQLVSVMLPLWHPHKQTLTDMIARTQVVKVPAASSQVTSDGSSGQF